MSETDPPLSPLDQLHIRIDESKARSRLVGLGFNKVFETIGQLHGAESRAARGIYDQVKPLAEELASLKTDFSWVEALRKAGFDPKTILQIWDLKDEISRNARDSKSEPKST